MAHLNTVAVIGNYLPRMCGIATFTTDLVTALRGAAPELNCWAMAVNDRPEGYRYPAEVRFEINQHERNEYRRACDFLNINQIDVVCLQHEYGIFGGETGSYILKLLRDLRMPVVTTLHTVLRDPTEEQRSILAEIAAISDRVVVMAQRAREYLREIYRVPDDKIAFVHHGIPDMPFVDPSFYKDQYGVEGRKVILTFGLLSPNKGVEYMIRALPAIVRRHPDVMYVVLGATHPHIRRVQGESYRQSLVHLAQELKVADHIIFHNRFVDIKELCEFLGCADVYVTPYLNETQIVSGTLAYAMGVGKATVSTPYWYAQEMMAEGRGVVVPFMHDESLAEAVGDLLSDDLARNAMRKKAYTFSRDAVWSHVARTYLNLFGEIRDKRSRRPRCASRNVERTSRRTSLPEIKLDHLIRLTDSTGILQHATFSVPNYRHGYCIDDNARALIVAVTAQSVLPEEPRLLELQTRYLSFLQYALNDTSSCFRNFMDYERAWMEHVGSEDSHGRALWGLGVACALSDDIGCIALSTRLLHRALQATEMLNHPRSIAFALVGIHAYLSRFSGDTQVRRARELLAMRLFERFRTADADDWLWFEPRITYANAKIPQALLLSGQWMQRGEMSDAGFRILNWLIDLQTRDGRFSPIGNGGWACRDGARARFDQQPIEAQAMLETSLLAYRMTGDEAYWAAGRRAFHWFLGQNDLNVGLYDYTTGGCRDGLQPDGPNFNQGAESTLAWLLSLIAMHGLETDERRLQYMGEGKRPKGLEQADRVSALTRWSTIGEYDGVEPLTTVRPVS